MIIAYEKNGSVYYDWGNRRSILVANNASLVSVSGNFIVYKKNGRVYKAEVNENGYIRARDIFVC